jgi:hypothetical protein
MRIVRDHFGLDRTTVIHEHEITGVGGNADEFIVVAEVGKVGATPSARTTVRFSHEEMARILADYRRHYPIDNAATPPLLSGPRVGGVFRRIRDRLPRVLRCCRKRSGRSTSDERQDRP